MHNLLYDLRIMVCTGCLSIVYVFVNSAVSRGNGSAVPFAVLRWQSSVWTQTARSSTVSPIVFASDSLRVLAVLPLP